MRERQIAAGAGGRIRKSRGIALKILKSIRLVVFDFDGVFTDNMVYVLQDGSEAVRCWRGDGIGLGRLRKSGIESIVLSSETNPVVSARCRKLGIRCVQGCEDKRRELERVARDMGIGMEQVAYVGNDINDLSCLTCVGLPIVVRNAHPDVVRYARYRTKAKSGEGAVREVCELLASPGVPGKD